MAMDPNTLLATVEAQIDSLVEGGHSSYSIGSRSVQKLNLTELYALQQALLNQVQRNTAGATFRVAKLGKPSR